MSQIIKSEIKRSFTGKMFLVAVVILTLLVVWYSVERIPNCIEINNSFENDKMFDKFLETSYTNWIGSHNLFLQQNILYFIIPLVAVIPYGNSLFSDINSGYIKNVCIRTKKSHYFIAKYIAVFLSGGAAVVLPMLLSFLISCAFLPSLTPEPSYMFTNIYTCNKWASLLFSNPNLYIAVTLLFVFVFSGLIACLSLSLSLFSEKSFLVMLFPFFVYIISSLVCELLDVYSYSIRNVITATSEGTTTMNVIVIGTILFVVTFVPYYMVGVRTDVY